MTSVTGGSDWSDPRPPSRQPGWMTTPQLRAGISLVANAYRWLRAKSRRWTTATPTAASLPTDWQAPSPAAGGGIAERPSRAQLVDVASRSPRQQRRPQDPGRHAWRP